VNAAVSVTLILAAAWLTRELTPVLLSHRRAVKRAKANGGGS
jgi:hypothetical protein